MNRARNSLLVRFSSSFNLLQDLSNQHLLVQIIKKIYIYKYKGLFLTKKVIFFLPRMIVKKTNLEWSYLLVNEFHAYLHFKIYHTKRHACMRKARFDLGARIMPSTAEWASDPARRALEPAGKLVGRRGGGVDKNKNWKITHMWWCHRSLSPTGLLPKKQLYAQISYI